NKARADSLRAVDHGLRLFLEEKLPALRFSLLTYPMVPQPTNPSDGSELYERAISSPPDEARALFDKLTTEHRDSETPTGLPIFPLAEWAQLRSSVEPTQIGVHLESLVKSAVETHPSVLTPELLTRAAAFAAEHGIQSNVLSNSQKTWEESE